MNCLSWNEIQAHAAEIFGRLTDASCEKWQEPSVPDYVYLPYRHNLRTPHTLDQTARYLRNLVRKRLRYGVL